MPVPPGVPPGTPPSGGQPDPALARGISDMQAAAGQITTSMQEVVRQLRLMRQEMADGGKDLKAYGLDFRNIMRDSADIELSMRRITQLQRKALNPGISQAQAIKQIKAMSSEYERLLKAMNKSHGGGRYVKEITAAMDGLNRAMKRVRAQSDDTWDADKIKEVNRELAAASGNVRTLAATIGKVKLDTVRDEFRDLKDTIDDAFGSRISVAMRRIPGLGHIARGLQLQKQFQHAQTKVGEFRTKRATDAQQRLDDEKARDAKRAAAVHAKFGRAGLRTLSAMGYATPTTGTKRLGGPSFTGTNRRTVALASGQGQLRDAARTGTGGTSGRTADGAIESMKVGSISVDRISISGKQGLGSKDGKSYPYKTKEAMRRDAAKRASADLDPESLLAPGGKMSRKARKRAAKEAEAAANRNGALGEALGIAGQMGGRAPKLGARYLKAARSRAGGSGAAATTANVGKFLSESGLAGGAGKALTSALGSGLVDKIAGSLGGVFKVLGSGPMTAVFTVAKAAIDLHDKVAEQNKQMSDALAGAGMFGGGGTDAFKDIRSVRRSLLSTNLTGNHMLYGQGFDENLKLYQTLGENGLSVGKSLRNGLDLNAALDGGRGFHGAVMQNAVIYGHMAGMDQAASVKQTLKLIDKFGQVTDATKGFFVDLVEFSDMSGISASRIVEMVDNITDQFTDLQRSLLGTTDALHKVGGASLFMGKRVEETVKGLTKPTEQTTAQRFYGVQTLVASGANQRIADSMDSEIEGERRQLNEMLQKYGVAVGRDSRAAIEEAISRNTDQNERQADMEAFKQGWDKQQLKRGAASSWRSGNIPAIVANQELLGQNGIESVNQRRAIVEEILKAAKVTPDEIKKIIGGDTEALQQAINSDSRGLIMSMARSAFGSNEDLLKNVQNMGNARGAGAQHVMDVANREAAQGGDVVSRLQNTAGKSQERIGQDKAKLELLERYGTIARGVTGWNGQGSAAQALVDFVRKSGGSVKAMGELRDVISRSTEVADDVFDMGSALTRAMTDNTTQQKALELQAKREAEAAGTTTSAMLMARAFKGMFDMVGGKLDRIAEVVNPNRAKKKLEEDRQRREANVNYGQFARRELETLAQGQDGVKAKRAKELLALLPGLSTPNLEAGDDIRRQIEQGLHELGGTKLTEKVNDSRSASAEAKKKIGDLDLRRGLFGRHLSLEGRDAAKLFSKAPDDEERFALLSTLIERARAQGVQDIDFSRDAQGKVNLSVPQWFSAALNQVMFKGGFQGVSGQVKDGKAVYQTFIHTSVVSNPVLTGSANPGTPAAKPNQQGNR